MSENHSLRVFISQSSRDVAQARQIYRLLKSEGWMDIWFVEASLKASQNWDIEIRSAVKIADVLIIFWSKISPRREAYFYPDPNFVIDINESNSRKDALILLFQLDRSVVSTDFNPESAFDYFPPARRGAIDLELIKRLKKFAKDKGFPTERRHNNPEPEQGNVWSSIQWREHWFMPGEEEIEQQEQPISKPLRPPSIWRNQISRGLTRAVYFSLTILVLFSLLVIGLTVNFVNTGETVNDFAAPVISNLLTLAPLPTPTPGVGSTRISPIDGMGMVYVPAGVFIMGSDDGADDEKPARLVSLDAYWIDRFEVTNGMYKQCVDAGGCNPPDYRAANLLVDTANIPFVAPIIRFYDDPRFENFPVSRIMWDDAAAYCNWAGRRLPTEAEWEKAARGTDGRTYPWGEEMDCTRANVYTFPADEACTYAPTRVGSYEKGVSPYGAYDMAGNVFEFVSDELEFDFETEGGILSGVTVDIFRKRKGGSWINSGEVARAANRDLWNTFVPEYEPSFASMFDPIGENGFRCAASVDAPLAQPVDTPAPPVELDPQVSPIDGMSMVHIPEGEFIMGSDFYDEDERPAHRVYLDEFWIDQYEVTNQQYARCMHENRCRAPLMYFGLDDHLGDPEYSSHPVTGMSWEDANEYCSWAGRRLPTEAEWEKAARGPVGQTYPWGEQLGCTFANYYPCFGDLLPVGSFADGQSLYGAYDMVGNVLEWVADWYGKDYYTSSPFENPEGPDTGQIRVHKGGSWANSGEVVRASNRFGFMANIPYRQIGLRCAASGDVPVTESILTTEPTVESNSMEVPIDGMQMLYVPAGGFIMGGDAYFEERPVHSVILDAFWIDQTEVTNAMFALFLTDWGNRGEGGAPWLDIEDEDSRIHFVGGSWRADQTYENHPVAEVTWYGANAYCAWVGRRLPTEAEWEKAARGITGNIFPWGNNNPTAQLLNFNDSVGNTTEVGSYPDGISPLGAQDMAGNVWEWVADRYSRTYYSNSPLENPVGPETGFFRVLRGGGWNSRDTFVRSIHRNRGAPTISHDFVGFRCAMSE